MLVTGITVRGAGNATEVVNAQNGVYN
jgi:hypothetical protein